MNFTFRLLLKNLSVFSSTLKSIVDSIVENNITWVWTELWMNDCYQLLYMTETNSPESPVNYEI